MNGSQVSSILDVLNELCQGVLKKAEALLRHRILDERAKGLHVVSPAIIYKNWITVC